MDDIRTAEDRTRYVPHGVDAQSWIGFEQRIQERRYRALLQQIDQAIERRDPVAARVALEEARELRPDAPDLNDLSGRVALIPIAPAIVSSPRLWLRGMSAVTIFIAGVALVVGIEWVRPLGSSRGVAPSVVTVPTLKAIPAESTPELAPTVTTPPESIVTSTEPDVAILDPVATAGVQPAVNIARPAVGGPATATFRTETLVDTGVQESGREVSDVDAAADSRRLGETNTGDVQNASLENAAADTPPRQPARLADDLTPPRESAPAAPALVASVAPVPASIGVIAPSAAAPAPELRTRATDEARVSQVLDEYARAYAQLDVRAARKVWPTVDERALARAFANLQSQSVSFEDCDVSVIGATARASCRGRATYVGKVGSRERRTEARQWTFELHRDVNDVWQIARAQAQRMTQ